MRLEWLINGSNKSRGVLSPGSLRPFCSTGPSSLAVKLPPGTRAQHGTEQEPEESQMKTINHEHFS